MLRQNCVADGVPHPTRERGVSGLQGESGGGGVKAGTMDQPSNSLSSLLSRSVNISLQDLVVWEQKPSVSKVTMDKTPTSSDTDAGSCCHLLHNPAVFTTVSWKYDIGYCRTAILQSVYA
jgi:hypothetical protein